MSRENFLYWKELVGLEEYNFPHLIPLDEENIQQARIAQSRIQEIRNVIATDNLVAIQVQPGWGATTLYRYMVNDIKSNRLNLLVQFDFEADNFQNGNLTEKEFIFQTKWKMANGMLDIMLTQSLPEIYRYEVFGYEDTGERPWKAYLREKRKQLNECEDEVQSFQHNFPFFEEMTIEECVNYFLHNFQIQTVFMFLFPRKADEDDVLEFTGILKNVFDGKDIAPAAIREVFFAVPRLFSMMKKCYDIPYKKIKYNPYSSAEIFGMLVNTYKLQDISNATISDVFEQEFITCVYNRELTLNDIMKKVEDKIIELLEGETYEIPYKLTLKKNGESEDKI